MFSAGIVHRLSGGQGHNWKNKEASQGSGVNGGRVFGWPFGFGRVCVFLPFLGFR